MAHTDQYTIGYERQIGGNMSFSADYVRANSRDLLMSRDLNPLTRATPNTVTTAAARVVGSDLLRAQTAALQAIYPGFTPFTAATTIPVNAAFTDYDAVLLQFEKRWSNNYSARVSYTYADSRGNTSGVGIPASGFQLLDDLNLDLNEGPTNTDLRHNLVVSGAAIVPKTGGLTVSWVARALSGTPFSLTNGNIDPDMNGSQSEPLAAGSYSGTGPDAYTVDNYKSERNGAYGPGFFKLDLRIGYTIPFSGRKLEVFGEIFNVTNRVNFANPSGNQAAPSTFVVLTGYSTSTTPRPGQFGARFVF
jgi:hypothetical protein